MWGTLILLRAASSVPTHQGGTGTNWEGTGAVQWAVHIGGRFGASLPPQPKGAWWSAPLISSYLPKPLANVTLMELKSTRFVLLPLSPNPPPTPRFSLPLVLEIQRGMGLAPSSGSEEGGQHIGNRVRAPEHPWRQEEPLWGPTRLPLLPPTLGGRGWRLGRWQQEGQSRGAGPGAHTPPPALEDAAHPLLGEGHPQPGTPRRPRPPQPRRGGRAAATA